MRYLPEMGSAALQCVKAARPDTWIKNGVAIAVVLGAATYVAAPSEAVAASRDSIKAEYTRPTEVPFPEDNLYTKEKAELGKKLFFDPRLSGADYISCATCHNPSFSWGDGLPRGIGHAMTQLGRRTPTILNSAFGELMMWDGRFESLEEQALGPMASPAEMNQEMHAIVDELSEIPGYRTLFDIAFPGDGITVENIAKAIATFERTVISGIAPFDRWIAGEDDAISVAAQRGFDLFNGKANCVACHSGWNFSDESFHDIGLESQDLGRGEHFPNTLKMQHAFKTPGLRNITQRGPFMHDGSVASLVAVVEHYNHGGIQRPSLSDDMRPLGLTDEEVGDIVAFMQTLDGSDEAIALPVLPAQGVDVAGAISKIDPAAGPSGSVNSGNSAQCRSMFTHWRKCP